MTTAVLNPTRFGELDSCNYHIEAIGDNTKPVLDALAEAVDSIHRELDALIAGLPDAAVNDPKATNPSFAQAGITLMLPSGPAKFVLHVSVHRKANLRKARLRLRRVLFKASKADSVQRLVVPKDQ